MLEVADRQAIELAEARFEQMVPLIQRLGAHDGVDKQVRTVLLGLAIETFYAFQELKSGHEKKLMKRLAPAARNLFELKYWIGYAMLSDQNIRRIHRDAMVDVREIFDRNEPHLDRTPADTQAIWGEARQRFDAKLSEHQYDPTGKHLEVSEMAKELGYELEYQAAFRFLSKFVHTSALLICVSEIPEDVIETMYLWACEFFNEACWRLNEGLKGKGLPTFDDPCH